MTIRPTRGSSSSSSKLRRLRDQMLRRKARRELRLETLEDRRLMAGLDLAGIATNQTTLLREGAIYNISPKELTFRFNDGVVLDEASLASGIEVIRSGGDGVFESASVRTDLNTNGTVIMEFTAVDAGSAGDGIQIVVTKNDRGADGGVGITVEGSVISVDLNTNVADRTTAAALRSALNNHPLASRLVRATVVRGNSFTDIATPEITYSPLTLTGANHAKGSSTFELGPAMEIQFTAVPAGVAGNGIRLNFTQSDFGDGGPPRITVDGRTINIELNRNAAAPTTAAALVSAINSHPQASQLVRARQTVGSPTAVIAGPQTIAPVTLQGASDVVITAGFVGYGDAEDTAVFRFAEPLVDDVYRINVLGRAGGGRTPVREASGDAFRDGLDNFSITFELDLGARVLSVVPQPIERINGQLVQHRNQIHVYFNDDDLDRALAENPKFYELILVQDTVRNTDDIAFRPTSVSYSPEADRAVLTFATNIDELGGPDGGTFRLRIGTDEAIPLAPATLNPGTDVGSSFDSALDLSGNWDTGPILTVRGGAAQFADGQTFTITDNQGVTWTFEFEKTVPVPPPVAGRERIVFNDGMSASAMAQAIAAAINNAPFAVTASVSGTTVRLANDAAVAISPDIRGLSKTTQALIVSGSITNDGQPYTLQFPGDIDEPGHRNINLPAQNHYTAPGDALSGITQAFYNFQTEYGFDPSGNVLRNAITEVQKQRVREIFDLYNRYFGIQFIESAASGMTIAVGDMRAVIPTVQTGPGGIQGVAGGGLTGTAVLDLADFDDQNDEFGGEFFRSASQVIGYLLGLGDSLDLPPLTIMGHDLDLIDSTTPEPVFPGDHDIVHGRFLYRPESKDIDLYRFDVTQRGLFTAETFAERLPNASQLDTVITLYRETVNGREVVARNDNYFSNDAYLELFLEPGTYYIGVSAAGNEDYDPTIADSGIGGTTQGNYELRLNFRGEATNALVDIDNANNPRATPTSAATPLDGDADGTPGGVFNFWFRAQSPNNTIFVDKSAPAAGQNGSLANPYREIDTALANAQPGDVVRILGNGGADGDIATTEDNLAYELGFSAFGGSTLADGANLQVPQGVTVMIDHGALFKTRRSYISVGSLSTTGDFSGGALQVLGVPRLVDSSGQVRLDAQGQPISGEVIFTSLHERIGVGTNPDTNPPAPAPGDWGGIIFRSDIDASNAGRFDYERQGIFLNSIYYADMRYGGGNVVVQGTPTVVDPVFIQDTRPTVAYSTITRSAHAAISANPNSFLETNFHSPEYQVSGAFTSDYTRVGPDISGVRTTNNTINGLFLRMRTNPNEPTEALTVAGRFDDTDIVHVLQENLIIEGNPGGPVLEDVAPPVDLVTVAPGPVGGSLTAGTYTYRITFVDANGNEGPASDLTVSATIPGNPDVFGQQNVGTIRLDNLPTVGQFPGYVARRIYRSTPGGTGPYTLVAQINGFTTSFTDTGATAGGELVPAPTVLRARPDARLRIDPGMIIKSESALIDVGMDATLIAEGTATERIVMTSLADSRYGAGGTFLTNNQPNQEPSAGGWAGIFAGHLSDVSIDHALIAFAGGTARVDGDFRSFNALEIHQAEARVANSEFESNASGFLPITNEGPGADRFGRGFNAAGTIFVRGAQPVIVNNIFRTNESAVININVNALNGELVNDHGRATGTADIYRGEFGNFGPLISGNRLDENLVNGMEVRGGTLTTESVWDDTDIVHVVRDTITVPDFHTFGGLRLTSKATESLVVKLAGDTAGFTATGRPLEIEDRIGGVIHMVGTPAFPVVLTSLNDCSVGAGFTPDGLPVTDTLNSGLCSAGSEPAPQTAANPGDWRSVRIGQFSHDRNVEVLNELEPVDTLQPGSNGTPSSAEYLGQLAPNDKAGDDNARLGFTIYGNINHPQDVDVYRFEARGGTEVWLDIDRTSMSLDSVVELVAFDGTVIARSDNSAEEATNASLLYRGNSIPANHVNPLQKSPFEGVDRYSTNPRDAGMRVVLPGSSEVLGNYYVRVRSSSSDLSNLQGGLTSGSYQLQVRLREQDEVPGSTIRYSDIRYATTGIEVFGQPIHSPLTGEAAESAADNNTSAGAQPVGNLLASDRGTLGIAGRLTTGTDIDFYRFSAIYEDVNPGVYSIPRHVPVTFDMDYADGLGRANTFLSIYDENGNLVLIANNSNVAEDRPGPFEGTDMDDLSRGSVGALDPFLGTVALPVGNYYATVSSIAQVPAEIGQFTLAAPVNPLLRLEPVNSVRRIAEDHINSSSRGTADGPVVPVLFDANSFVPWTLGDVTLYVSQDPGTVDQTNLYTVNPFTGQRTTQVGRFNFDVGDIAMRPNGNLMAYSLDLENFPFLDATTGQYLQIDTGTGVVTVVGASGIQTWEDDPANPGTPRRSDDTQVAGIHFQAMAFGHTGDLVERGFAVGSRPNQPFGIPAATNILYEFVPTTGTAVSAPADNRTGADLLTGAGTQIVERGRLLTDADPLGTGNTVIVTPEATRVDADGITTPIILDGTRFAVDDGGLTQFEFVSGPEVRMTLTPGAASNPIFIRDGDTFFLDGQAFEFDTGEVLVITAQNGNFISDGDRFTITDNQDTPVTRIFEWDNGTGPALPGNVIPVPFNVGMSRQQLVQAVVAAINSQTAFNENGEPIFAASAQALPTADGNFNNRISLINSTAASETSNGMTIEGNYGLSTSRAVPNPIGTHLIRVEEISSIIDVGHAILQTFNGTTNPPAMPGVPNIDAGVDGNRVNFVGPNMGDFSELVSRGVFTDLGHDGTPSAGAIGVPFLAHDAPEDIAQRMADALNAQGFTATVNGPVVTLSGGAAFDDAGTDDPPLTIAGAAPGGEITGTAFIGTQMYAVSDAGGLYRIVNYSSAGGAFADYIESATDLLGIPFEGLTAGPRNVEGGRYANLLFGITGNGRIYAFNTAGELQPIFANGSTFVDTGITNANGLDFSILDTNLWHTTTNRQSDPGHGINQPFDGSRAAVPGGTSLWFGWESQAANRVSQDPFYNPVNNNADYDFPGGAHGSLVSNEFSLEGYAAEDLPVLYFNYRLATENASATIHSTPEYMRDAFRVYVAGEDGVWHLLATNNSGRRDGAMNDEYDDLIPNDGIDVEVQELFDVGDNGAPDSWRQARISLAPFAGQSNLKLRFDFSTAGALDFGNANSTGSFLQAVLGSDLRDGQVMMIDSDTFEFDMGYTLVAPTGAKLTNGETLTIHGRTFEFTSDGTVEPGRIAIPFNASQSASAVASEIRRVLDLTDFTRSASMTAETGGNDTLATAVLSGIAGGADAFRSSGVIGDNANLADPALDVDLIRLNLNAGDQLRVSLNAATGSSLDPLLRLFDANGNQIAINDNANGVNAAFNLTMGATGTYYLGISGAGNNNYDPLVSGSGTPGSTGAYNIEIQVNGFTGVETRLHDNRIQLDGATRVMTSAGSSLVIDGSSGVSPGAIPISVHADMTKAQVAAAVQQALADRYSGGVLEAFKVDRDRVQVVGHTVASPGPLGLADSLMGDQFGAFYASTRFDGTTDANFPGALRAQNNDHEGVYIDDIIIGFAERGEMVTGATANTSFINNPALPANHNEILVGDYQLEIRQAEDYAVDAAQPVPTLVLTRSFDTNDRQAQAFTLTAPKASDVIDGQTFQLSDGVNTVTFEFEDVNIGNGVQPGRIAIPFDPSAVQNGGVSAESDIVLAQRIRDAINSAPVQNVLKLRAALSDGAASGTQSTSAQINLFGNAVVGNLVSTHVSGGMLTEGAAGNDTGPTAVVANVPIGTSATYTATGFIGDNPALTGFSAALDVDLVRFELTAGTRVRVDVDARIAGSLLDPMLRIFDVAGNEIAFSDDDSAPGEPFTFDPYIDFVVPVTGTYYIGVSSYDNRTYDLNTFASGTAGGSTGSYTLEVTLTSGGLSFTQFDDKGDTNLYRDQGQLILHSNRISHSAQFGINVDAGVRDGGGDNPHQGPPRVTREVNQQRLVPGVVIENNIVDRSGVGGIRFSGDNNASGGQIGSVPFGRIMNNTLYGGGTGVGISVENNASPTLLNNIVASFELGLNIDATSTTTVVGGTLYKDNVTNSSGSLGTFPLVLGETDPLFVDAEMGNFYLASNSPAIDSGINSVPDRPAMTSVRSPLGIPQSPIVAPQRDLLGQLRVDDDTFEPPPGAGQNPFIDRGAIDRADTAGPVALLIDPRDNDALSQDTDPRVSYVRLANRPVSAFSIQLRDGIEPVDPANGSGIDDATVTSQQVRVFRDGELLREGYDYRFNYDAQNDIIRLTPVAGVWAPNHTYVIQLANVEDPDGGIRDHAGNSLQRNREVTTEFSIQLGSGLDFGDAPESLGYPTFDSSDGARHLVVPGFSLGSIVDVDVDGQPTLGANGDDLDGDDDEDGVVFGSMVRGYGGTVTVTATGVLPNRPGFLDAWIDFNGDGDWDDAGEQIAVSVALVNGENVLNFDIPETAQLGETYARFRLSSTGGLSPIGLAADGEVEDHRVVIGSSSWHNAAMPNDVSGDGRVNSYDVLVALSFLVRAGSGGSGSIDLPSPPPLVVNGVEFYPDGQMVDVDGNGRASIADVRRIITALVTGVTQPEGELLAAEGERASAEGEPESSSLVASDLAQRLSSVEQVGLVTGSESWTTSSTTADTPVNTKRTKSEVREVVFNIAPAKSVTLEREDASTLEVTPLEDLAEVLAADQQTLASHEEAHDSIFAEWGKL